MDLSEIFLHILETHHLTQRKASSILQYSSPNQLQRITKKEVSDKLMMDFGERLLIHREELDLTPDEIVSIRQCLFFPSMKKPDYNYAACLFATLYFRSGFADKGAAYPVRLRLSDSPFPSAFVQCQPRSYRNHWMRYVVYAGCA